MFSKIYEKLFYNPEKEAKKNKSICIDASSVVLSSTKFKIFSDSNLIKIGKNTMVGCNFIFESDKGEIILGDNTFINGGTSLISREKIIIGSNVTIAWGCTIYDHNSHSLNYLHRREDINSQLSCYRKGRSFIAEKNWNTVKAAKIIIEDDVWIGFGCTILKGVTIGRGAIVGAQSVVRDNVEPWVVIAGNPAVVLKRLK